MKVYAKEFNTAVANVVKSISKDKYRPVFQKIHMVGIDDGIMIESCDGFRLHRSSIYIIDHCEPFDILVNTLDKVPTDNEEITIKFENDKLVVNGKAYDYVQNYKGLYLDTDSVFPKRDENMCILLNVKYLKEALQHVKSGQVELRFEQDFKTGGIDPLSPIVLAFGTSHNMILPIRPGWKN